MKIPNIYNFIFLALIRTEKLRFERDETRNSALKKGSKGWGGVAIGKL